MSKTNFSSAKGFGVASAKKWLKNILAGPSQSDTVFVGLASIPVREQSLRTVVESLLPQVTELGVYLNNWDEVPEFLRHPKIRVARSQDHGDVRDNGKFFWVERTSARFYATVDDDIHYPANYIRELKRYQQLLGGTNAVGVHATTYPQPVTKLLRNRHLIHFSHASDALLPVDMIGTGTLFFERAYWSLKYEEMGTPGMADVWFASATKRRDFGLWNVPRQENWLKAIEQDDPTDNLFREGRKDDSIQVSELNKVRLGSSRMSLLERLVRTPAACSRFGIADAKAIDEATTKIGLEPMSLSKFRFFSGAILAHKRESNEQLPPEIEEGLDAYVIYLLRQATGNRAPEDLIYEEEYRAALKSVGFKNLPEFAQRDWKQLGLKTPNQSKNKPEN